MISFPICGTLFYVVQCRATHKTTYTYFAMSNTYDYIMCIIHIRSTSVYSVYMCVSTLHIRNIACPNVNCKCITIRACVRVCMMSNRAGCMRATQLVTFSSRDCVSVCMYIPMVRVPTSNTYIATGCSDF